MYEALTVLLEQKTICTIILVIAYLFTDDALFQSTVHNLIISTISTEKKNDRSRQINFVEQTLN